MQFDRCATPCDFLRLAFDARISHGSRAAVESQPCRSCSHCTRVVCAFVTRVVLSSLCVLSLWACGLCFFVANSGKPRSCQCALCAAAAPSSLLLDTSSMQTSRCVSIVIVTAFVRDRSTRRSSVYCGPFQTRVWVLLSLTSLCGVTAQLQFAQSCTLARF